VSVLLEICVDDAASVEAAIAGGADRIELCSALELGGLTPSPALLARAVATGVPVHAMIRPRGGGFVLKSQDLELMVDEIGRTLAAGAAGIVIGALRIDSGLDSEALARFRDAARGAVAILHRAIDLTPDPVEAVRQAVGLGYDKILSSGGAPTVLEGAAVLARMVQTAAGRLSIIAGSGVSPDNVHQILARTGVREIHASASIADAPIDPPAVRLGFGLAPRRMTDADIVRRLRVAIADHIASTDGETKA
jgi:copper homeostasis protein